MPYLKTLRKIADEPFQPGMPEEEVEAVEEVDVPAVGEAPAVGTAPAPTAGAPSRARKTPRQSYEEKKREFEESFPEPELPRLFENMGALSAEGLVKNAALQGATEPIKAYRQHMELTKDPFGGLPITQLVPTIRNYLDGKDFGFGSADQQKFQELLASPPVDPATLTEAARNKKTKDGRTYGEVLSEQHRVRNYDDVATDVFADALKSRYIKQAEEAARRLQPDGEADAVSTREIRQVGADNYRKDLQNFAATSLATKDLPNPTIRDAERSLANLYGQRLQSKSEGKLNVLKSAAQAGAFKTLQDAKLGTAEQVAAASGAAGLFDPTLRVSRRLTKVLEDRELPKAAATSAFIALIRDGTYNNKIKQVSFDDVRPPKLTLTQRAAEDIDPEVRNANEYFTATTGGVPADVTAGIRAAEGNNPRAIAFNLDEAVAGLPQSSIDRINEKLAAVGIDPYVAGEDRPIYNTRSSQGAQGNATNAMNAVRSVDPVAALRGTAFGRFQVLGMEGSGGALSFAKGLMGDDVSDAEAAERFFMAFEDQPEEIGEVLYARWWRNNPRALNLVRSGNFSAEDLAREYYGSDKPEYKKYTSGPNKGELVLDENGKPIQVGWIVNFREGRKQYRGPDPEVPPEERVNAEAQIEALGESIPPTTFAEEEEDARFANTALGRLLRGRAFSAFGQGLSAAVSGDLFQELVGVGLGGDPENVQRLKALEDAQDNFSLTEVPQEAFDFRAFADTPYAPAAGTVSYVVATAAADRLSLDAPERAQRILSFQNEGLGQGFEAVVRDFTQERLNELEKSGTVPESKEDIARVETEAFIEAMNIVSSYQVKGLWTMPVIIDTTRLDALGEDYEAPKFFRLFEAMSPKIEVIGRNGNEVIFRQEGGGMTLFSLVDSAPIIGQSWNIGAAEGILEYFGVMGPKRRYTDEVTSQADNLSTVSNLGFLEAVHEGGIRGVSTQANLVEVGMRMSAFLADVALDTDVGEDAVRFALNRDLISVPVGITDPDAQVLAAKDKLRAYAVIPGMAVGLFAAVVHPDLIGGGASAIKGGRTAFRALRRLPVGKMSLIDPFAIPTVQLNKNGNVISLTDRRAELLGAGDERIEVTKGLQTLFEEGAENTATTVKVAALFEAARLVEAGDPGDIDTLAAQLAQELRALQALDNLDATTRKGSSLIGRRVDTETGVNISKASAAQEAVVDATDEVLEVAAGNQSMGAAAALDPRLSELVVSVVKRAIKRGKAGDADQQAKAAALDARVKELKLGDRLTLSPGAIDKLSPEEVSAAKTFDTYEKILVLTQAMELIGDADEAPEVLQAIIRKRLATERTSLKGTNVSDLLGEGTEKIKIVSYSDDGAKVLPDSAIELFGPIDDTEFNTLTAKTREQLSKQQDRLAKAKTPKQREAIGKNIARLEQSLRERTDKHTKLRAFHRKVVEAFEDGTIFDKQVRVGLRGEARDMEVVFDFPQLYRNPGPAGRGDRYQKALLAAFELIDTVKAAETPRQILDRGMSAVLATSMARGQAKQRIALDMVSVSDDLSPEAQDAARRAFLTSPKETRLRRFTSAMASGTREGLLNLVHNTPFLGNPILRRLAPEDAERLNSRRAYASVEDGLRRQMAADGSDLEGFVMQAVLGIRRSLEARIKAIEEGVDTGESPEVLDELKATLAEASTPDFRVALVEEVDRMVREFRAGTPIEEVAPLKLPTTIDVAALRGGRAEYTLSNATQKFMDDSGFLKAFGFAGEEERQAAKLSRKSRTRKRALRSKTERHSVALVLDQLARYASGVTKNDSADTVNAKVGSFFDRVRQVRRVGSRKEISDSVESQHATFQALTANRIQELLGMSEEAVAEALDIDKYVRGTDDAADLREGDLVFVEGADGTRVSVGRILVVDTDPENMQVLVTPSTKADKLLSDDTSYALNDVFVMTKDQRQIEEALLRAQFDVAAEMLPVMSDMEALALFKQSKAEMEDLLSRARQAGVPVEDRGRVTFFQDDAAEAAKAAEVEEVEAAAEVPEVAARPPTDNKYVLKAREMIDKGKSPNAAYEVRDALSQNVGPEAAKAFIDEYQSLRNAQLQARLRADAAKAAADEAKVKLATEPLKLVSPKLPRSIKLPGGSPNQRQLNKQVKASFNEYFPEGGVDRRLTPGVVDIEKVSKDLGLSAEYFNLDAGKRYSTVEITVPLAAPVTNHGRKYDKVTFVVPFETEVQARMAAVLFGFTKAFTDGDTDGFRLLQRKIDNISEVAPDESYRIQQTSMTFGELLYRNSEEYSPDSEGHLTVPLTFMPDFRRSGDQFLDTVAYLGGKELFRDNLPAMLAEAADSNYVTSDYLGRPAFKETLNHFADVAGLAENTPTGRAVRKQVKALAASEAPEAAKAPEAPKAAEVVEEAAEEVVEAAKAPVAPKAEEVPEEAPRAVNLDEVEEALSEGDQGVKSEAVVETVEKTADAVKERPLQFPGIRLSSIDENKPLLREGFGVESADELFYTLDNMELVDPATLTKQTPVQVFVMPPSEEGQVAAVFFGPARVVAVGDDIDDIGVPGLVAGRSKDAVLLRGKLPAGFGVGQQPSELVDVEYVMPLKDVYTLDADTRRAFIGERYKDFSLDKLDEELVKRGIKTEQLEADAAAEDVSLRGARIAALIDDDMTPRRERTAARKAALKERLADEAEQSFQAPEIEAPTGTKRRAVTSGNAVVVRRYENSLFSEPLLKTQPVQVDVIRLSVPTAERQEPKSVDTMVKQYRSAAQFIYEKGDKEGKAAVEEAVKKMRKRVRGRKQEDVAMDVVADLVKQMRKKLEVRRSRMEPGQVKRVEATIERLTRPTIASKNAYTFSSNVTDKKFGSFEALMSAITEDLRKVPTQKNVEGLKYRDVVDNLKPEVQDVTRKFLVGLQSKSVTPDIAGLRSVAPEKMTDETLKKVEELLFEVGILRRRGEDVQVSAQEAEAARESLREIFGSLSDDDFIAGQLDLTRRVSKALAEGLTDPTSMQEDEVAFLNSLREIDPKEFERLRRGATLERVDNLMSEIDYDTKKLKALTRALERAGDDEKRAAVHRAAIDRTRARLKTLEELVVKATPEDAGLEAPTVDAAVDATNVAPSRTLTEVRKAAAEARKAAKTALDAEVEKMPKGMVTFLLDSTAILFAFRKADISTGLHEMSHVLRRALTQEDVESILPVINKQLQDRGLEEVTLVEDSGAYKFATASGQLDSVVEAEELFARGFERYMREGSTPNTALQQAFSVMKDLLRRIYTSISGSEIDVEISVEMYAFFDKVFGATDEVQATDIIDIQRYLDAQRETMSRVNVAGRIVEQQYVPRSAMDTIRQRQRSLQDYRSRGMIVVPAFLADAVELEKVDDVRTSGRTVGPGIESEEIFGPVTRRLLSNQQLAELSDGTRSAQALKALDMLTVQIGSFAFGTLGSAITYGGDPMRLFRQVSPEMRGQMLGYGRESEEFMSELTMRVIDAARAAPKDREAAVRNLMQYLRGNKTELLTGAQRGQAARQNFVNTEEAIFNHLLDRVNKLASDSQEILEDDVIYELARLSNRSDVDVVYGSQQKGALSGFWQQFVFRRGKEKAKTAEGSLLLSDEITESLDATVAETTKSTLRRQRQQANDVSDYFLKNVYKALTSRDVPKGRPVSENARKLGALMMFHSDAAPMRVQHTLNDGTTVAVDLNVRDIKNKSTGSGFEGLLFGSVLERTMDDGSVVSRTLPGLLDPDAFANLTNKQRMTTILMMAQSGYVAGVYDDMRKIGFGITASDYRSYMQYISGNADLLRPDQIERAKAIERRFGFTKFTLAPTADKKMYIPVATKQSLTSTLMLGARQAGLVGERNRAAELFLSIYGYVMQTLIFGGVVQRQQFKYMSTIDLGTQLGLIAGGPAGVAAAARVSALTALTAIEGERIADTADAAIRLGRKVAPESIASKLGDPGALKAKARRAAIQKGDELGNAISRFFGVAKYRVEVLPIMENTDQLYAIGGRIYRASDLRRTFTRAGMYSNAYKDMKDAYSAKHRLDGRTPEARLAQAEEASEGLSEPNRKFLASAKEAVQDMYEDSGNAARRFSSSTFEHGLESADAWSDLERTGGAVTLMEMGYTPSDAAKIVVDAVYDYRGSMSRTDQHLVRRVLMPFFAFRKNAMAQATNLFASPEGAFRTTAFFKALRFGAEGFTEVLYENLLQPYDINISAMPIYIRNNFYATRLFLEYGLGDDPQASELEPFRAILPKEDAGISDEQLMDYDFDGWTIRNGYGGYRNVPEAARVAMRALIAARKDAGIRTGGDVKVLNEYITSAKIRNMYINEGATMAARASAGDYGIPAWAARRVHVQVPIPVLDETIKELLSRQADAVAKGASPADVVGDSLYFIFPDNFIQAGIEHAGAMFATSAVLLGGVADLARGQDAGTTAKVRSRMLLNAIEPVFDVKGMGSPIGKLGYEYFMQATEDSFTKKTYISPWAARLIEGSIGAPLPHEGDRSRNPFGYGASALMSFGLPDVKTFEKEAGGIRPSMYSRRVEVVVEDAEGRRSGDEGFDLSTAERKVVAPDRSLAEQAEYALESDDSVAYRPYLTGYSAINYRYSLLGIIENAYKTRFGDTPIEEAMEDSESWANWMLETIADAAKLIGGRVEVSNPQRAAAIDRPR